MESVSLIGCSSERLSRHWMARVLNFDYSYHSCLPIQQAAIPTGSILGHRGMSSPPLRLRERFRRRGRLAHFRQLAQMIRSIHRTKRRTCRSILQSELSWSYRFSQSATRHYVASISYTTSTQRWMRLGNGRRQACCKSHDIFLTAYAEIVSILFLTDGRLRLAREWPNSC
jgi:hypothetical protein